MRVLHVVHYPVFGGPHNQALRLAAPLREHGVELTVLVPDEAGNAAPRLRAAGIDVVSMPLHRLRESRRAGPHLALLRGLVPEIGAIRRLVRERRIDVVEVAGLVNPHAAIAARAEGVPVVWQLIDTRAPWPVAAVSMLFVRSLAAVVMTTGVSVALAHPGGSALRKRLLPFFPPVDTQLFRPAAADRAAVRAEWGLSETVPVVGCVGNINPQKGIDGLIRAFALVHRRIPEAKLVLIGAEYETHAEYSRSLRRLMHDHGLSDGADVLFRGDSDEVHRQLMGFDVFAFTPVPRGEGISTVVLEAMSAGLPVVTSAVAGLADAVESGIDGVLTAAGDRAGVADAILGLLSDPPRVAAMGAAARTSALRRFGIAASVADHLEAYRRATVRRRR